MVQSRSRASPSLLGFISERSISMVAHCRQIPASPETLVGRSIDFSCGSKSCVSPVCSKSIHQHDEEYRGMSKMVRVTAGKSRRLSFCSLYHSTQGVLSPSVIVPHLSNGTVPSRAHRSGG